MGWDSVVLWPALCGPETFWNYSQSVDTHVPDLTPCFQQTALLWLPCGLLWLCLPFYTPYLISQTVSSTTRTRSKVNVIKIVISAVLAVLAVVDLIRVVTANSVNTPQTVASYVDPTVRIATFVISAIYIDWEFRARIHSSGVFFLFWFLLVLCGIVPFRSQILQVQRDNGSIEDPFGFSTFYIYYGLSLIMLALTAFVTDHPSRPEVDDEERRPLLSDTKYAEKRRDTQTLPCPEEESSFLSRLTNWWITGLLIKGFRNPLTFTDLYDVLPDDRSEVIFEKFSKEWQRQVKKKKPSLLRALVMTSVPQLIMTVIFRAIDSVWPFLNPLALPLAIEWVSGKDPYMWKGYGLAVMLFAINALTPTLQNLHTKNSSVVAFRVRTAIVAAVYRKALKLSSATRRSTTVGEIVNLMSVDAQKIHDATENIHEVWAAPIMFSVALVMLWNTLGPSSLASLAVYAILLPIFFVTGAKYEARQERQMKHKDERIKMTNELLSGIKVLKMYAWEPSFARMITDIRGQELRCLRSQSLLSSVLTIAWNCANYVVPLAMFGVFVLSSAGNYLDPQTAFVTISLVGNLSWGAAFIMFLPFYLEAFVSMDRISAFLAQDELDPSIVGQNALTEYAVDVRDGSFSWGADSDGTVLNNIDLQAAPGSLVAVVGAVGAGKSSLISALLGELKVIQGSVNVKGSVAYVPQQAWIQNKTLRDNILFNQSYSESRYSRVIDACALQADFKMLPAGDMTEIGEKGINLSGGQKQRVSVARSIYQSADVYLLDDPLSAVDAHIGKHLFDKVVGPDGLLRHTTRIFVTHGVTYLPRCDVIVVMRDGEISEYGTYAELLDRNAAFADFLRQYLTEIEGEEEMQDPMLKQLERQLSHLSDGGPETSDKESGLRRRISRILSVDKEKETEPEKDHDKHATGNLIEEEEAAVGTVGLAVVWNYFRAVTVPFVACVVVSSAIFVASSVGQSVWLSKWSDDPYMNGTEGTRQTNYRLGIYAVFGLVQICSSFCATLAVLLGGVKASKTIHKNLLTRIIRAPMAFFDTTPLGRILNRFSGDIDTIDTVVPNKFDWWLFAILNVISTLVVICYSTPVFTAVLVPIVIVYFVVQRAYIRSVRQLQRIDSIRRSPLFVNFDETLVGVASVRAYGRQEEFIDRNDRIMDDSNRAWYPILIARRWLGLFLDMLGAAIIFFATLFAVLSRDSITGGLVGLSLSFSFTATFLINVLVTESSELETNIVAAERIRQYSNVESEAPLVVEDQKPPDGWPDGGEISFRDYSTRYRPGLDLVLKAVNLSLRAGEKVGVVGRTGAGKSSMALSLFRIIEPAKGSIVIDGVDITKIGLHDLRSQLTVIPQEAALFSGSIRRNLDPFDVYSDDVIWKALEHAHLKSFVSDLPTSIEHDVGEGGEALSVGQRQLVCLARALLRKSRVLVLDEATAAVDMETDDLIQATIRSDFAECTVLTIAHRLNTIMDYDRVMVLDGGEIVELDSPASLLENPKSVFYGLAKDAGLVA